MPEIFAKRVRPGFEEELSDYMEEDEEEQAAAARLPPIGFFQHPQDPVDEGDFDDDKEQKLIVSLTRHHERPIMWHAQCITIWKQLVETAAEANQQDATNPRTVWDQYPNLFQYLAEGGPDGEESVLTPFEVETGRVDLNNTIDGRIVVYMAMYEREMGRTD
ncbi:MAG: hypothetical protein GY835_05175, partial [bacterium]|nr:hypothetical protein [bacterium]